MTSTTEFQELEVPRNVRAVSNEGISRLNKCSCIPHCCDNYNDKIPKNGWRKWSLFIILFVLLTIIVINLGLTLWLMTVMKFSGSGMGELRVFSGGIQVDGDALIMDNLVVSKVSSREGQDVEIRSYGNNITITTQTYGGLPAAKISLDPKHVEYFSDEMSVRGIDGNLLFHINEEEVAIGSEKFTILSDTGAIFEGSVQVPEINSVGKDLKIESLTRSILVEAPDEIHVRSNGGNVEIEAQNDLTLMSSRGALRLAGKNIYVGQLDKAFPVEGKIRRDKRNKIYQLCSCENGRLFLAGSATPCETSDIDYICQ